MEAHRWATWILTVVAATPGQLFLCSRSRTFSVTVSPSCQSILWWEYYIIEQSNSYITMGICICYSELSAMPSSLVSFRTENLANSSTVIHAASPDYWITKFTHTCSSLVLQTQHKRLVGYFYLFPTFLGCDDHTTQHRNSSFWSYHVDSVCIKFQPCLTLLLICHVLHLQLWILSLTRPWHQVQTSLPVPSPYALYDELWTNGRTDCASLLLLSSKQGVQSLWR